MSLQSLQEKWAPVLNHEALPGIEDTYKKGVVAQLLENQEIALKEEGNVLNETLQTVGTGGFGAGATATGPVAGFDPVLISLIRRSMPMLIAYDIAGVQPMTGPTGLIFAMRTAYGSERSPASSDFREAFFNEPNAGFSGAGGTGLSNYDPTASGSAVNDAEGANPGVLNDSSPGTYEVTGDATGMNTTTAEALDDSSASTAFREMGFSIEKVTVTAKSRALKAEYSIELAQDLKAIHGLDAEQELSNILSTEILAEINREVVRTIYTNAVAGAQNTANAGIFDLDVDSNGRWSVEKFKGLLFQIERDANAIGQQTRRGKGNILICSADVASALGMAGVLDYTPALSGNNALTGVDDTSSTLVGTLNGRIKVYVDPYSANVADKHFYVSGYKGTSPYDAGLFYCPYVPLQQVRAINPNTFQPKIGFKTRYGMVSNPFAQGLTQGSGALTANTNKYYRRVQVANIM